jgi:hypothetical protein
VLLVLSGSRDGTCDLLFGELNDRAFRFNIDIYKDYRVEISGDRWLIENPVGKSITSEDATRAHWWKAFNFFVTPQPDYVVEEVKYIFSEIYNWFCVRDWMRGNLPDFHKRMGKIVLLNVAKKYFSVPDFLIGWNFSRDSINKLDGSVVAKSLTSGLVNTDKALYTTQIEPARIDLKYPWFLQQGIDAKADVTIQLVGSSMFAFSRSREGLEGLDWRKEIFSEQHDRAAWLPLELTLTQKSAVKRFAEDVGVNWGRLDLLETDTGLVFLEFNANGQWAFLDIDGRVGLLDAVINYLVD